MLGVSLVYTFAQAKQGEGIHWDQAGQVLLSLLISPIVGFGVAALILLALRKFLKTPGLFEPADPEKAPPHWVRGLLIVTCTGVSFAHGSNDGQKGMGLLMLVLRVALPSSLALNTDMKPAEVQRLTSDLDHGLQYFTAKANGKESLGNEEAKTTLVQFDMPKGEFKETVFSALITELKSLRASLADKQSIAQIPLQDRPGHRQSAFLAQETLKKLAKEKRIGEEGSGCSASQSEKGGGVYPDLGESDRRLGVGTRHHDRMASHCDDGCRTHRKDSFGLCARRFG